MMVCFIVFLALPQGSGYSLYLFYFTLQDEIKKDAATIPNAIRLIVQAQNKRTTIFLVAQLFL